MSLSLRRGCLPLLLAFAAPAQGLVRDIVPGGASSHAAGFTPVGDAIFFRADDGIHGEELWISDGTPAGTRLVADIAPGGARSLLDELIAFGGMLLFVADDGVHGKELWRSDGTAAGTFLVADLALGAAGSVPAEFVVFDGHLYFSADDGVHGRDLWRSDGTVAGTARAVGLGGIAFRFGTVAGDLLFFSSGGALWCTDGTPAGTRVLDPGPVHGAVMQQLTAVGDRVFYRANSPTIGRSSLCVTDGTLAGTTTVRQFGYVAPETGIGEFTAMGGELYFVADVGTDRGLWRSDGTAAGTHRVAQQMPLGLVDGGGLLFFATVTTAEGSEPWISDGTAAGTRLLRDVNPGSGASNPQHWARLGTGRNVVFAAYDPALGIEPWRSDGTLAGTYPCADVLPGPDHSWAKDFVRAGACVFFTATTPATGFELFAMPIGAVGASVVRAFGSGCNGTASTVPRLQTNGEPLAGDAAFAFTVAAPLPHAFTVLAAGFAAAALDFGGCTVLVEPPWCWATAVGDAQGVAVFAAPIPPAPGLVGLRLFLQSPVLDPQGTLLGAAAVSNALDLIVGG